MPGFFSHRLPFHRGTTPVRMHEQRTIMDKNMCASAPGYQPTMPCGMETMPRVMARDLLNAG